MRHSYTQEINALIDLPARISAAETVGIILMTLVGTVLAALYLAIRAADVDPASVLRYE